MTGTSKQLATVTPHFNQLTSDCYLNHSVTHTSYGGQLTMTIGNRYPLLTTCYFDIGYVKCVYR
ncbi:MAG TPA: hypothetical protein VHM20_00595 [Gammaproteobacteria bacterium]|nr:hypothetical protein [Gammaproteobacteria bacterium]